MTAEGREQGMDHLSDREILILTADRLGNLIEKVEIQNGRIGRLESWRLQILGGGLALMALMPFLIVLVNRLFESGG